MAARIVVDTSAFKRGLAELGGRQDRATGDAINEILRVAARQERTLLDLGRHPPGTKTGSPPGSPPWFITGHLHDSVKVRRAKRAGAGRWAGQMGPTAVYARIQELGGDTGRGHRTHLPPRPHLYPAWRIVRPTMRATFVRFWADAQVE